MIFPDQILATVLPLRVVLDAEPLAVLFGTSRTAEAPHQHPFPLVSVGAIAVP